jgi:hypothetical protein
MPKKIGLSLAVSLMSLLPAQAALGATITLNPTCTFAKAVTWINAGFGSQSGCTKSGTFGSNDTIIVGLDHQAFSISSTVEIKKSLTVTNWWNYAYLNVTNANLSTAIRILAKDIQVAFTGIILTAVQGNNVTAGFSVDGTTDTTTAFTPKLILNSSRVTGFRRSGIRTLAAGVTLYNSTLDSNSNATGEGGAVRIDSSGTKYGRLEANSSSFVLNSARRGGAVYNHGNFNADDSYFSGNIATDGGSGKGGVVYSAYFPNNFYTNFAGGNHFENNHSDQWGYPIAAGDSPSAQVEFSGSPPNTAVGNRDGTTSMPVLCQYVRDNQPCPAQPPLW